ncbi:MAG: hypothetical protein H7641_09505 [Candidatus Heimdallarchaeota archaeon]|nr:hypothetical protein [Candidatus Heimdallarchaeota archaeon]MCK4877799.1 hypothetical protein [Candidatus Heimdallarchaeota archaeon]
MNKKITLIGLGFIALMVLTMGSQAAPEQGIDYEWKNGIATVETENVTISVNTFGNLPGFHYKLASGLNYTVIFKQLIEYEDLNEDGVFQSNESLTGMPFLTLTSISWIFSDFDVEETEGLVTAIHFNFTADEIIGVLYDDLDITIAMHLYLEDQVIDGYELVGGTELKFDLYINGWPWDADTNLLALRFDIILSEGMQVRNQLNLPIDTTVNNAGNEKKLENKVGELKQELTFQNEEKTAFFGYSNEAQIKNQTASQYEYGSVNASYCATGDNVLRIYLSFEHFDYLIYDPSLGTYDSGEEDSVPFAWVTAIIAPVVFVAALKASNYYRKR